jgi:hypothetical protein
MPRLRSFVAQPQVNILSLEAVDALRADKHIDYFIELNRKPLKDEIVL